MLRNAAASLLLASASAHPAAPERHWVASWSASASPRMPEADLKTDGLSFEDETVREVVHLSLGGSVLQIRLSNLFGAQPLEIAAGHVALRAQGAAIVAGSDRTLTFAGATSARVPPAGVSTTDPVSLQVPPGADLSISLYLRSATAASSIHYLARQTSYAGKGNLVAAASIPNARKIRSWVFLSGVDVDAPGAGAIVAFGDSLTDGDGSSVDRNARWTDALARRLDGHRWSVVNAGIIGNRLLHDAPKDAALLGTSAESRFLRDALEQPGAKYVVLELGGNDIGLPGSEFAPPSDAVGAEEIVAALKRLAQLARQRGLKVIGATLAPSRDASIKGYFDARKLAEREAVNRWIRTAAGFDAVIDFDNVVRDPAHPDKLLPAWDSGDHLHPNDEGYAAVAASIDVGLFR